MPESRTIRRLLAIALGVVFIAAFAILRLGMEYWSIERDEFDPVAARERIEAAALASPTEPEPIQEPDSAVGEYDPLMLNDLDFELQDDGTVHENPDLPPPIVLPDMSSPPVPDEKFASYLLIGSDLSGYLADTIILVLVPSDGSVPLMASLPRDLYLPSLCSGGYSRLNVALGGCRGVASGPELLSLTIEDFTGVPIDHYVLVGFSGFAQIIDVLGGVQVCVDNPTRDTKAKLELEAGCNQADGATTLAWVRSRRPEELINDEWVRVAGASDFTRQSHQQDVLRQLFGKLGSFGSVASAGEIAQQVANHARLDSGFSIGDAASVAWSYRGIAGSSMPTVRLSYSDYRTPGGARVLLPAMTFAEALAKVYSG
jgi:LCP family protein required for cell wall assembly